MRDNVATLYQASEDGLGTALPQFGVLEVLTRATTPWKRVVGRQQHRGRAIGPGTLSVAATPPSAPSRRPARSRAISTPIVASHAHACAITGRQRDAERILAMLEDRAAKTYVSSAALALVHVGLGQLDRALELFEQALRERSGWLVLLPREPRLDPLRSHPRFQTLLREVEAG